MHGTWYLKYRVPLASKKKKKYWVPLVQKDFKELYFCKNWVLRGFFLNGECHINGSTTQKSPQTWLSENQVLHRTQVQETQVPKKGHQNQYIYIYISRDFMWECMKSYYVAL